MTTTIQISDEVWEKLNAMKKKRGETFEDILRRLLHTQTKHKKEIKKNED